MKRIVFSILAFFIAWEAKAQITVDTLSTDDLNTLLIQHIECLAEDGDEGIDYEDLLENYLFFCENPINLNSDETAQLLELQLINAFQYEELNNYRRLYGDLLFLEELKMVEGFDEQTIRLLKPIVCLRTEDGKDKITLDKMARHGKHKMIGHYEQILEKQEGYKPITDSALLVKPNSRYLGSPQRYQLKYTYNYRDKIRAGFVLEKDPGELFFSDKVGDTIQKLLGNSYHRGFDFAGFHLYAKNMGIVKAAVVGDYHLTFGQGLTMWSGINFGKAFAGSSPMKRGRGISPKPSSGEYAFMRGAAVTLGGDSFSGTVFYSNRKVDANVILTDSLDEVELVSSLQETGYHRTVGELQDRHAVRQQIVGGHLSYATAHFEIGYTLHHTWLDTPLNPTPTNYNQYYFQGTRLTNQGVNFNWVKGKYALFGEVAMRWDEGDRGAMPAMMGPGTKEAFSAMTDSWAGLIGLTVKPAGYLDFTLLYRDYGKAYQNLYSNAFGEGSLNQGQRGIFLAAEVEPAPYWSFLIYTDQFQFTWLTSQVYTPSWGHDYYLRLSHSFNKRTTAYLQIHSKTKMKNSTNAFVYSYYPIYYTKNSIRFNISYELRNGFVFNNKAEYAHYRNDEGNDHHGFFICHDIVYKPESKPYSLTFRYALFDAPDYDARVYAYESDVLYAFSVPAYYGKGMRIYLLGKWEPFKFLTLYARIGSTVYIDRETIGSGLTLIESNHKTDLKVEVVWKPKGLQR